MPLFLLLKVPAARSESRASAVFKSLCKGAVSNTALRYGLYVSICLRYNSTSCALVNGFSGSRSKRLRVRMSAVSRSNDCVIFMVDCSRVEARENGNLVTSKYEKENQPNQLRATEQILRVRRYFMSNEPAYAKFRSCQRLSFRVRKD